MVGRQDVEKRRLWEVRFGRFRTSGLTVCRFCEQERCFVAHVLLLGEADRIDLGQDVSGEVGQGIAAGSPVREAETHGGRDFEHRPGAFPLECGGGGVGAGRLPGRDSLSGRVLPTHHRWER